MAIATEIQPLLLASASPRRRELLALTGLAFEALPAAVDETPASGEAPEAFAERMSREKAQALADRAPGWVVAADTIVVDGGRILGKPSGPAEARAMLNSLCGKTHTVFTALTLLDPATGRRLTDLARTEVPMRAYSAAEIEAYLASGDPFDKAGAYAIQHTGFHPVEDLRGCYANVMGFPLCHLARTLRQLAVTPPREVAQACQAHLEYDCPVYQGILDGRP
jgi:MAF protein